MLTFYTTYGCYVFIQDLFFGELPVEANLPPSVLCSLSFSAGLAFHSPARCGCIERFLYVKLFL